MILPPPSSTLFPYTTLFRSVITHLPCPVGARPASPVPLTVSFTIPSPGRRHRPDLGEQALRTQGLLSKIGAMRSEEHTSELQSLTNLVCRLLLEKKKTTITQ